MTALLLGLITGFVMCIPIGPLNIWSMNICLKKNFGQAFALALGGSVMDFIYFFIIMSGLSFIEFSESQTFWFKAIGTLLILIVGIKEFLSRPQNKNKIYDNEVEIPASKRLMGGYFLLGIVVYTSNPTLIVTMSGLGAFIQSFNLFESNLLNNILISLGLALGSALWFFMLLKLTLKYRELIQRKFIGIFGRISGILLVSFGLYMGRILLLSRLNL